MNSSFIRKLAGTAGIVLLALPLAACGDEGDSDGGSSSQPEPVAVIEDVHGQSTAVTLDAGFAEALDSLGLTAGVAGSAKLTDGALVFPISGGNV